MARKLDPFEIVAVIYACLAARDNGHTRCRESSIQFRFFADRRRRMNEPTSPTGRVLPVGHQRKLSRLILLKFGGPAFP
jgi:hypothetical protein